MIVVGFLGLMSVVTFVAWVVFHEPWVRSHGDPAGPNARHHADQLRERRQVVTHRALARLRDTRDASDAGASSDYFRDAIAAGACRTVSPGVDHLTHLQRG